MIDIAGVGKRFGATTALRDVTLTIPDGRITAVIGPNGSGKTTLIKCLLGLVTPTSGTITINGVRVNGDAEYRRQIGYMPQIARFPDNLRVGEVLDLVRRIRRAPVDASSDLFASFGLDKEKNKKVSWLSGGTRQKLSAVLATMFQPAIQIFDEPTAGLDPLAREVLREQLRRNGVDGRTVIITSHFFSEVEALADDIAFLCDGSLRFAGSLTSLRKLTGEERLDNAIARLMQGIPSGTSVERLAL